LLARNACTPKYLAPFDLRILNASKSCPFVMPYLESPGLSMIQEHTASQWATITTDDFAQQRYCSKAMERQNSSEEQKLRQTTLQPLTALMILK
jgi:hypothetical protein